MTYQETVTPTFHKDWPAAIAAGFEQIRDNRGYRNTLTDVHHICVVIDVIDDCFAWPHVID